MNIAEKCDTIENENPNNRRNPLVANNVNVKKLEADLWESADLLRAGSKLTSNQYCMPVLGLIFLRYAYSRFKLVEQEILKDRPMRGGRAVSYTHLVSTLLLIFSCIMAANFGLLTSLMITSTTELSRTSS